MIFYFNPLQHIVTAAYQSDEKKFYRGIVPYAHVDMVEALAKPGNGSTTGIRND